MLQSSFYHYPSYFLQELNWAKFWQEASGRNHFFYPIEVAKKGLKMQALVYEYPWFLGQSFLYIPKGPIVDFGDQDISSIDLEETFKLLVEKIIALAKSKNCTFIKFDFDDNFCSRLQLENNENVINWFKKITKLQLQISNKKIQYLKCTILETNLVQNATHLQESQLSDFYQETEQFWEQTNQKVRRYNRKSLDLFKQGKWQLDSSKNEQNFQHFWQIHKQTTYRQGFASQSESYLRLMMQQDFGRIFVLKDEQNQPHCVWLGLSLNNTLYYLCGGNDEFSFENWGQYLIHIAALQSCALEKLAFYDLGGWEENSGYSQFKDGYRAKLRQFLGPIDLILKNSEYFLINNSINAAKNLQQFQSKLLRAK